MKVTHVHKDTGEINCIFSVGGDFYNIAENTLVDDTWLVKYVPTQYQQDKTFGSRFWWNHAAEAWQERSTPPGIFYQWNTNSLEWDFNLQLLERGVRNERDRKLPQSDWTQTVDAPLTTEKKAEWATYRQALRDLPANIPDTARSMSDIVWPTEPT